MAKPSTLRSFLLSMMILSLVGTATSCKTWQTIMIPRYASGSDRVEDPFGGNVFRLDHSKDGRDYALLAVAIGDKLFLAAQVSASFVGDVRWSVGECQLDFTLESAPHVSEVPFRVTGDLGITGTLVGQPTATEDDVTVRVEVPRRVLANGDGMLLLEFVPRDGSEGVVLPASGRLRGVYLMQ